MLRPHDGIIHHPGAGLNARAAPRFLSFRLEPIGGISESILSDVRRCASYTRLSRLWTCITAGLNALPTRSVRGEFRPTRIELFVYDCIVARIVFDDSSGATIEDFGGLGMPGGRFLRSLEGCEIGRNKALRCMLSCSLGRFVFLAATGRSLCGAAPFGPAAFRFCFAPEFSLHFGEQFVRPYFFLRSSGGRLNVSTQEIMLLQTASRELVKPLLARAVSASRAAIVLLQLDRALCERRVSRAIENGKIHFIYEPFDCVEFKIKPSLHWTLSFLKPRFREAPSLAVSGRGVSARFVEFVLHLVTLVCDFFPMWKQARDLDNALSLAPEGQLSFCCSLGTDVPSRLQVAVGPLEYEHPGAFRVLAGVTPRFEFAFGHLGTLGRLLDCSLKEAGVVPHFGAFLRTSFVPYYCLHAGFSVGKTAADWAIAGSRTDRSFHLVYRRVHTFNVVLEPAHIFQFVVPSVGTSIQLATPLREFLSTSRIGRLSHLTFQLPAARLGHLRKVIEDFFIAKDGLEGIGFGNVRCADGRCTSSLGDVNYSFVINCELSGGGMAFSVCGDEDVNAVAEGFLNRQWDSIHTRLCAVGLVAALRDCTSAFTRFALEFAAALAAEPPSFGVDLNACFADAAGHLTKNRITFHILTAIIEIGYRNGGGIPDLVAFADSGDVLHFKSIKSLMNWIHSLRDS
jgi:hypothetical protein